MVRRGGVSHLGQDAGAGDRGDRRSLGRQVHEERRLLHVGRLGGPLVDGSFRDLDGIPELVGVLDAGVFLQEGVGGHTPVHQIEDLGGRRPDVPQVNVVARGVGADRILCQVDVHRTGQGVGHDQRGRGQEVGLHHLVDAAFEVAVAGKHTGYDQVSFLDGVDRGVWQRTGVADAGRAAVAHQVEADGIQVWPQSGVLQVVGHDLGARRQGGLYVGLDLEAALDRFLGYQAGADHDAGVGRVGAARDGGNGHVPVSHLQRLTALVMEGAFAGQPLLAQTEAAGSCGARQGLVELPLHGRQFDVVLRTLRSREGRRDGGQVQFEDILELRIGRIVRTEEPLGLCVALNGLDHVFRATRATQESECFLVDGEEAHRGAVFGGHVGNRGAVRDGHVRDAGSEEFDKLADHPVAAEQLGHFEDQVGGRGAFGQLTGDAEADDFRHEHVDGLIEHDGFGFDAAHAPADHTQPVDHGGVAVRTYEGVGIVDSHAVGFGLAPHATGNVFKVHLVADARSRRHDSEIIEGALSPAQEFVALGVALELFLLVDEQGLILTEGVHLDGVVDDQVHGHARVDFLGVASQAGHGTPHGGQVHDGRYTGKVLQQHTGRHEGDLYLRRIGRVVGGQFLDVRFLDKEAVAVAERALEQHLDRIGEAVNAGEALVAKGMQAVEDARAGAGVEGLAGSEKILGCGMSRAHDDIGWTPWGR